MEQTPKKIYKDFQNKNIDKYSAVEILISIIENSDNEDERIECVENLKKIRVVSSLPKIVDPEIDKKITWQVTYSIPFSILNNYHNLAKPGPGTIWRANFYKCADDTSYPHWLTWAPIDFPTPNFHVPEYFGEIEF